MNKPTFQYKPPKIGTGELRTPVSFFVYQPAPGFTPDEEVKRKVFDCYAEIYNPSAKDHEILSSVDTEYAVTINIRDSKGQYTPSNKHFVEINDYRYKGITFSIIDVRYDFANNAFINILLGAVNNG